MSVTVRRVLAYIVDMVMFVIPATILFFSGPQFKPEYLLAPSIKMFSWWGVLGSLIVGWGGVFLRDLIFGKTSLGKRIFGLRVVAAPPPDEPVDTPYTHPSVGGVILRNLLSFYPLCLLDLLIMAVSKGVSLGDNLSKNRVVLKLQA